MTAELNLPEINEMKKTLEDLQTVFSLLVERTGCNSTVNITDIARMEGTSVSQLRKGGAERYLLPNFGVSEYPDGKIRWSIATYMSWHSIPVEERKRAYLKHLREEMKRTTRA